MSEFLQNMVGLSPALALAALGVGLLAGVIKGLVGFAMPMVLIAGLGSFLPPDVALAALILPTFVSNGVQALQGGVAAAWAAVRPFWVFMLIGALCLIVSAQFVTLLDPGTMFLLIGVPIVGFGLAQLAGARLPVTADNRKPVEAVIGAIAGAIGGVSGVWGPPTVMLMTALETPKDQQMKAQGMIYGLGAVLLLVTHSQSGVLRADTWPLSLAMIPPTLIGLGLGMRLGRGLDQARFRRLTLIVVVIAGANLIRRGLM